MALDDALVARLRASGLIGTGEVAATPLTGGVASDIWHVEAGGRSVVVKKALEKLKVAADWHVPVTRNAAEVVWLERAGQAVPGAAPEVLAHWPDLGAFVMAWLPPQDYPVWKTELMAGRCDLAFAAAVGTSLSRIHGATAGEESLAAQVNDDALFTAIRLEPYFARLTDLYPKHKPAIDGLIARTLANKKALVHGDVSPKNILAGADGPVFLDAECAVYGDPAFDLAFVLNHLLLKALIRPGKGLMAAFRSLGQAYLSGCDWEAREGLEVRAASLLPALLLARVDGKSPVEYLDEPAKHRVRAFALRHLSSPPSTLEALASQWETS